LGLKTKTKIKPKTKKTLRDCDSEGQLLSTKAGAERRQLATTDVM